MRQPRKAGRTNPVERNDDCVRATASEAGVSPDQWMWRVNPHTGQVATLVSGSTIRKLVQPLVLQ